MRRGTIVCERPPQLLDGKVIRRQPPSIELRMRLFQFCPPRLAASLLSSGHRRDVDLWHRANVCEPQLNVCFRGNSRRRDQRASRRLRNQSRHSEYALHCVIRTVSSQAPGPIKFCSESQYRPIKPHPRALRLLRSYAPRPLNFGLARRFGAVHKTFFDIDKKILRSSPDWGALRRILA